jgi:CheY-like chemotaxis protein
MCKAGGASSGVLRVSSAAGPTILVVEDEALVRMIAVETLEDCGFAVLEAGTADAALAMLDANPSVALLLTDVGLPGMNGRDLADAARQRRPALPVIFMTGYSRGEPLPEGMITLGKPFTPEQLQAAVTGMLVA